MIVLLHGLHAGIILAGVVVVLVLIGPPRLTRHPGRVEELRAAAESGTLVRRAETRARAQLTGTRTGRRHGHLAVRTAVHHPALVVAATGSLTGAAIHAAVGPEHFEEGWRFGVFFVVLAAVQAVQSVLLVRRPSVRLLHCAIAVNAATVALWVLTRTVGLPFALAEIEPVGVLDLASSVAEVVAVGALARALTVVRPADASVRTAIRRPWPRRLAA